MRHPRPLIAIPIFVLPLILLLLFTTTNAPLPPVHADSSTIMSINPAVYANRTQTSGRISVTVDLANSPSIDWFSISFSYNRSILHAVSINYTSGIFGNNVAVAQECIDGVGVLPSCQAFDGLGVVTLSLFGSASMVAPPIGQLFQTSFNVTGIGFSQFHLFRGFLHSPPALQPTSPAVQDGYFTNSRCGQSLCKPPVVSFTISPIVPLSTGIASTFNASASQSSNSGSSSAGIARYSWDWGDGSTDTISTFPIATHTYKNPGPSSSPFIIALTATDAFGISWIFARPVEVVSLVIDLSLKSMMVDQMQAFPGTRIHITGLILNNSTIAENATGVINVGSQSLVSEQFSKLAPQVGSALLSATWDTTGLSLGRYAVQASVIAIAGESSISNNILNRTIELIPPPDLQLAVAPSFLTLDAGSEGNVTITLSPFYGFTGTATLAVNSTTSLTGSFSANPVFLGAGSSMLSVLSVGVSSRLRPGSYTLVVTAYVGSVSRSVSIPVRVDAPRILPSASLTILGLPPIEFWIITSGIIATVVFGGALAYRRRKRSFYLRL